MSRSSRHRIPACALELKSDPIGDRYQAEVDSSMARLEQRHRKAEKALRHAEEKSERKRQHVVALAAKHAEAERIAANRTAEEHRLTEYIARIKEAAKSARVAEARAELERKHRDATERRNAQTAQRRAEAKAARDRLHLIARHRAEFKSLESLAEERRRELREIERLMMPESYAGRVHRGRGTAQHQSGGVR